MDVRRQQVVAAADAVRAWVQAQRAAWDNPYLYTTMPVARPAPALSGASEANLTLIASTPADPPASQPVRTFGIREAIDGVTARLSSRFPVTWPSWGVATAAILVLLTAGTAKLFWPSWTRTIAKEIAVGRQVVETGRTVVAKGRQVVHAGREVVEKGRRVVAGASAPAAVADAAVRTPGALHLETDPAGATVFIDGRERGVTPLTLEDLAPATYNVLLKAGGGSVQHKVVVIAGQTAEIVEGIFSGWLRVVAPIDVLVSEDSRGLQLDDSGQVLLAPGAHDILVENRSLGFREIHHVNVRPGDTTTLAVELPLSSLTVTSTEPADVTIDGEPAGATPLADYQVAIGPRGVTVTAASGAVRRATLTMTTQPARLDVDFSKP